MDVIHGKRSYEEHSKAMAYFECRRPWMLFIVKGHMKNTQKLGKGIENPCMLGLSNFYEDELLLLALLLELRVHIINAFTQSLEK